MLFTHGWSFVAACRDVRNSSSRIGVRLIDGLGIAATNRAVGCADGCTANFSVSDSSDGPGVLALTDPRTIGSDVVGLACGRREAK